MTDGSKKFLTTWAFWLISFICVVTFTILISPKANATDQSSHTAERIYPQLRHFELEEQYLKLKVDWDDKSKVTSAAAMACYDLSGDKKVKCYIGNSYFDKKQISEKALSDFVEFKQKYEVK